MRITKSKFIDTHMHLDLSRNIDPYVAMIENRDMYVVSMSNLPSVYKVMKRKIQSDNIRIALGLHPQLVFQYPNECVEMLSLIKHAKYIGEIGLDLQGRTEADKSSQIVFFKKIIDKCNETGNKVLSIHSKGSVKELLSCIDESFSCAIIMHWYSGSLADLQQCIDRGYYFSINLSMMRSMKGKKIIDFIPIDRLLTESDYPFIKINDRIEASDSIPELVNLLAKHHGIDNSKMKEVIYRNFARLLKI